MFPLFQVVASHRLATVGSIFEKTWLQSAWPQAARGVRAVRASVPGTGWSNMIQLGIYHRLQSCQLHQLHQLQYYADYADYAWTLSEYVESWLQRWSQKCTDIISLWTCLIYLIKIRIVISIWKNIIKTCLTLCIPFEISIWKKCSSNGLKKTFNTDTIPEKYVAFC